MVQRHAAEERDVVRLQRTTLTSIVATLSGSKDERLAKHTAEADAARLRVDGHRARLRHLATDLESLDRDLAREHEEARQAGIEALAAVEAVLAHLGGARRWSTFDLFGGGLLADSFEHDRLNQAHGQAWHAQRRLDVFARQLADVGVDVRPQLPPIDTRWFVDAFFDNVITDAIRHNRIERTGEEIAAMAAWIRSVLKRLDDGRSRLRAMRDEFAARRQRLHGLT